MICPKCGYTMENNSNRCDNCGYMINEQYNPNGYAPYSSYQQNQAQNQYGEYNQSQYNTQPKKKSSKWLIVIIIFILAMLCCCGGGFGIAHWINGLDLSGNKSTELLNSVVFYEDDISINIDNTLLTRDTSENYDKYIIWVDLSNFTQEEIKLEFNGITVNDINVTDIDVYEDKEDGYNKQYEIVINLDNEFKNVVIESFSFSMKIIHDTYIKTTSKFELHHVDNLENAYFIEAEVLKTDELDAEVEDNTESNTKKYGSDIVGYVELTGTWADFYDVDVNHSTVPDMKQYSNVNEILTLNMVQYGDAKKTIENLKETFTGEEIESVTMRESKFDNRYGLLVRYKDNTIIYISCKTIADKMYYFALETVPGYFTTPAVFEEYANNIIDTYTY